MTTCSAPGKILLAGGYLVLDPAYSGLVLSLSARIYATVRNSQDYTIVTSPQFKDAVWKFDASGPSGPDNPFIREAVSNVLLYLDRRDHLEITIHADNQYYSLPKQECRFSKSTKSIAESPKTGLGSSAALVTAVTAAVYIHLTQRKLTPDVIWHIHNLAQISHCRAQGKVGSGFDVAAAVFGSCLYSRFPASMIPSEITGDTLRDVVNSRWPMTVERKALHRSYQLLMGDVAQGSATPGMVKAVLASKEALDVWPSLAISNEILAEQLTSGSDARETTTAVRGLLKQMGVLAKVDIEPDEQTALLDETAKIKGVVSCGVPGAGGYDAIFAIVSADCDIDAVEGLWKRRKVSRLDVHNDHNGVSIEHNFKI